MVDAARRAPGPARHVHDQRPRLPRPGGRLHRRPPRRHPRVPHPARHPTAVLHVDVRACAAPPAGSRSWCARRARAFPHRRWTYRHHTHNQEVTHDQSQTADGRDGARLGARAQRRRRRMACDGSGGRRRARTRASRRARIPARRRARARRRRARPRPRRARRRATRARCARTAVTTVRDGRRGAGAASAAPVPRGGRRAVRRRLRRALTDCRGVSTIYVTGHRNPDTDSIASAIGYAELKRPAGPAQRVRPRAPGRRQRADALGARAQRRRRSPSSCPTSCCACAT